MRLLIVEDDLEASEAMVRGLAEAGHNCIAAENGEAGLGVEPLVLRRRNVPDGAVDGIDPPLEKLAQSHALTRRSS